MTLRVQSLAFADSSVHVVSRAVLHNPLNEKFKCGAKLFGEYDDLFGAYFEDHVLLRVLYGCVGQGPNTTIRYPRNLRAALPIWLKRAACRFP